MSSQKRKYSDLSVLQKILMIVIICIVAIPVIMALLHIIGLILYAIDVQKTGAH